MILRKRCVYRRRYTRGVRPFTAWAVVTTITITLCLQSFSCHLDCSNDRNGNLYIFVDAVSSSSSVTSWSSRLPPPPPFPPPRDSVSKENSTNANDRDITDHRDQDSPPPPPPPPPPPLLVLLPHHAIGERKNNIEVPKIIHSQHNQNSAQRPVHADESIPLLLNHEPHLAQQHTHQSNHLVFESEIRDLPLISIEETIGNDDDDDHNKDDSLITSSQAHPILQDSTQPTSINTTSDTRVQTMDVETELPPPPPPPPPPPLSPPPSSIVDTGMLELNSRSRYELDTVLKSNPITVSSSIIPPPPPLPPQIPLPLPIVAPPILLPRPPPQLTATDHNSDSPIRNVASMVNLNLEDDHNVNVNHLNGIPQVDKQASGSHVDDVAVVALGEEQAEEKEDEVACSALQSSPLVDGIAQVIEEQLGGSSASAAAALGENENETASFSSFVFQMPLPKSLPPTAALDGKELASSSILQSPLLPPPPPPPPPLPPPPVSFQNTKETDDMPIKESGRIHDVGFESNNDNQVQFQSELHSETTVQQRWEVSPVTSSTVSGVLETADVDRRIVSPQSPNSSSLPPPPQCVHMQLPTSRSRPIHKSPYERQQRYPSHAPQHECTRPHTVRVIAPGQARVPQTGLLRPRPSKPLSLPQQSQRKVLLDAPWRNVWKQIERGLDGLLDIEDVISKRAQQLLHSAASVGSIRIPQLHTSPSKNTNQHQHQLQQRQSTHAFHDRRTDVRFTQRPSASSKAPPNQRMKDQDEIQFHLSRFDRSKRAQPTFQTNIITSRPFQPRSESTDEPIHDTVARARTRKLFSASGGASVLQDMNVSPGLGAIQRMNADAASQDTLNVYSAPHRSATAALDSSSGASQSHQPSPIVPSSSTAYTPSTARSSFADDDDDISWMARLGNWLPPIPRFSGTFNLFRGRRFYNDYSAATLDAWKEDEDKSIERNGVFRFFNLKPRRTKLVDDSIHVKRDDNALTPTLTDLLDRCQSGKNASLLTRSDVKTCRSVGRSLATVDLVKLVSMIVLARHIPVAALDIPRNIKEITTYSIPLITEAFLQSWAPFAVAAFFLAIKTDSLIYVSRLKPFLESLEGSILEETKYASLFLRILSSSPLPKDIPSQIISSSQRQAIAKTEIARLRFLVVCLLSSLIIMTVTMLGPLVMSGLYCISQIASLKHWNNFSTEWKLLLMESRKVIADFIGLVSKVISDELGKLASHPVPAIYEVSVFLALLSVSLLPILESKRRIPSIKAMDEEEEISESHARFTEHIAEIGGASASRLDILANGRAIESLLERWKFMQASRLVTKGGLKSSALFRIVGYRVIASCILSSPLIAFGYAGVPPFGSTNSPYLRWDSLLDVSVVALFTYHVVGRAITACVLSKDTEGVVSDFLSTLFGATDDRRKQMEEHFPNLHFQASFTPTAGILVKDLWAAHTNRRAWAVRGANIACRSGEIVLLLGDAGSGRTRLLTSLAEAIMVPPRRAATTTRVRGLISFGGLEVGKWNQYVLSRRLGLFLSDVRTVADVSRVLSGLAIEEVLEPSTGIRPFMDLSHNPGSTERTAMTLALQMSGLYSTLLPRLPSKLSTIVTANEEDLRPSSLRPRYHLLTSVEWTKLLLSRVLTQAIIDNENAARTHETLDQCLVGSYLMLDDVTAYFSEFDEARLMQDLRRTGAAVLMSSNRWSTGRFADRIAVLKDGAIIESGSHRDLLHRGPQHSIYAARWQAMTSQ